ncbi:zinc finger protein 813-like isoform X1 [Danaus plexippus]|uniref:zinc finger protein 813-like isoform X1 n=1 Tax=Danaus plexippus TaxID=13037 RepID=UPI002AB0F6C4|nr:zinc finger protein 813-like isoform X1 [Danaus plexippus]XP_032514655.2 zinc finger protein 813-like isoform X1 [Danaus plexippus]
MTDQECNDTTKEDIYPVAECRACLQVLYSDSNLLNIFEPWTPPWDGMENTIAEDLVKLTNIQISETDKHSKFICETCYQVLLGACHFTACVRKSYQILLERYPCESQIDVNNKVWPKPIQVDKTVHSSMYQNPVDVEIKQEAISDEEYSNAMETYDEGKDNLANLDIKIEPEEIQIQNIQIKVNGTIIEGQLNCDSSSEHVTNGNSTMEDNELRDIVKEEPLTDDDENDNLASDLPLECLLCSKAFNSVTGLKAHVIAQHSYKSVKRKSNSVSPQKKKCNYICAICRRRFSTSTDLMVHETCHNKSVCYGCNQSFDTFAQLTVHRRTCKAVASRMRHKTLDDVLRPQTQVKQPKKIRKKELHCTECNETFSDVYYKRIHEEVQHSLTSDDVSNKVESMEVDVPGRILTRNKRKEGYKQ